MFLRGLDDDSGQDPDAAKRTSLKLGGNAGPTVGSYQGDDFKSHHHSYSHIKGTDTAAALAYAGNGDSHYTPYDVSVTEDTTDYPNSPNGTETRPKNIAVYYLIFAGLPIS
jgi:hypothetical protein